jgi:hypothetical protein
MDYKLSRHTYVCQAYPESLVSIGFEGRLVPCMVMLVRKSGTFTYDLS